MRVYRLVWQAVAAALALTGVGIALLAVPLPVLVLIAVYLIALDAHLYRRHPLGQNRSSDETAEPGGRSLTSRAVWHAGVAVAAGTLGLLGWVIAVGPAVIGVALLLAAGAPASLTWYRGQRRRRRPAWPPATLAYPMPVGDLGADRPADPTRGDRVAAELAASSLQALCWRWRTSFPALQASPDPRAGAQVAQDRQLCLDELERRAPLAFRRWLDSGPRAAGDPSGYLLGSAPARDHRTTGS